MLRKKLLLLCSVFCLSLLSSQAQWNPANPVLSYRKLSNGIQVQQKDGVLRLEVCSPVIVHVTYSKEAIGAKHPEDGAVIKKTWDPASWNVTEDPKAITLTTEKIKLSVTKEDGAVAYLDLAGQKLTTDSYRSLRPVTVNGEKAYHSEVFFAIYGSHEGIYGLGQHQAGVWNYRGESVDLSQENTNIAIPFLVSTNGYGIFWNNSSRSRFNNRFVHSLYVSSEVADDIDYYFFYGPEFDDLVASYRTLTGSAPMFGRWAYGFWQCKNKYTAQDQLLSVAEKYRQLHIPADNIVQDWFWWENMGQMKFNKNYPDPQGMIDGLHKLNFHLMVSIWPYYRPGSQEYDTMKKNGWLLETMKVSGFHPEGMGPYDPTNPEASKFYWDSVNKNLFAKGVDSWWLDTDEPETEGKEDNIIVTSQLKIGSGARYANIFPLAHTANVYNGQRAASEQKRVFILSRSAYAGAQRNGITAWSGDVLSDYVTFERQISAGLNYAVSGMPYWTTDIGGFISGGNLNDPKFRELFVRWFQFGVFSPIFRIHGTRNPDENELWSYGPEAQKILVEYDKLRYRMLPYIYSLAWKTTHENYTPMRPLVMDYRKDVQAQNIGDQFLYGSAFLVNPVYKQGATSRTVYLPEDKWIDFWTGELMEGGKFETVAAPLEKLPLYVRAGSIVPFGPEMEWSTQKPADPIELRIYPGANGDFTLYEDENDNYNYEKGSFTTVPFHWNDKEKRLSIGDRKGAFPGMLQTHVFHVVLVGKNNGVGPAEAKANRTVTYSGKALEISLSGKN